MPLLLIRVYEASGYKILQFFLQNGCYGLSINGHLPRYEFHLFFFRRREHLAAPLRNTCQNERFASSVPQGCAQLCTAESRNSSQCSPVV